MLITYTQKYEKGFINPTKTLNNIILVLNSIFLKLLSYICVYQNNNNMNTNRLKGLIREKGYTQISFCDKVGVSITVLKNCFKNKKTDTDTLKKMCEVLEVSSSTILNF